MAKTANEELFDASVKHQIFLQRLSTGTVHKILETLDDVEDDIITKLAKADITEFSQTRLKGILAEIRKLNQEAFTILEERLGGELHGITEHEADFQARLLEKILPVEISLVRPSVEVLKSIITSKPLAGRFIKDEVKDLQLSKIKRIEQALRIGVLEGETNAEIIRRIRGTRALNFKDGILNRSRGDIERLVRTSITHVTARARDELYSRNQNVVKKWRFVATLDSRTSNICISLDGTEYDTGEGPMPPRHPNCRSTSMPILKSWQEMGFDFDEIPESTRSSLDGQVPETLTYQQWLRKQPREFVEDVLGKTKSKLFLDGKMPVDRFVDLSGRDFTLDELRSSDQDIFARLQI